MKKINEVIIFAIGIFLFNFQLVKATHVAGADITYENVGIDSFLVTVNIFEDCGGSVNLGQTITVYFTNSCGLPDFNLAFNRTSVTEVSQLCASDLISSTCGNGTLPGILHKVYQEIVVLESCNSWEVIWGIANRNATINIDPAGNTYFFSVNALINTAVASNNISPMFYTQPIPYVCANQLTNYSFGVNEQDGDSLVYSFTDPLGGTAAAPVILNYQPGYTVQQPIPGITIDSNTGLISFTSTVLGSFVVVIKVEEYRNGVLIGYVKRDMQFVVRSCTNNAPNISDGEVSNLNGNAVQTGPYAIELCDANNFSFTASFSDQDIGDTLEIISNISNVLPGANITITGTNPVIVNISWIAPSGSFTQNNSFSITVKDKACPIPGIQVFVYDIDVVQSTSIHPASAVNCSNVGLQLNAFGGNNFTWYDINGVQIIPNNFFSCNNCPNPIVSPSTTTSYIVESNLSNSCTNRDTILVIVLTAITPIVTQVGFSLEATLGYDSYQWYYNNVAIQNETNNTFTPALMGNYYVMVIDNNGCQAQSAVYNVTSVGAFELSASTNLILLPNPACAYAILKTTDNTTINGNLKVRSINGAVIFEKQLNNNNQLKIDIESWANGMYLIEIIGDKKTERIKFIKQD